MGAPFGAGKLKLFSTTLPLTDSAAKLKKGFVEAARGTLGEGCHSLTHQAPREVSAGFAKHRASGAQKGLVDLAQLALFLHPISQPRPLSCLPVSSGDGNPRRDEKWQCGGPWQQKDPSIRGLRVHPAQAWTSGEATARASELGPQHVGMAGFRGLPWPLFPGPSH